MTAAHAPPAHRLPLPRLLAFAVGGIPATMLVTMMGVYLPPFYAGRLGISLLAIGGTIATVRLADLGVDLLLGWMMDKTRTRFGRYKPWFALALPVLWVAVYQVFNPPEDADLGYLFLWFLVLYAAYSILMLSHSAWGASLSGDYHERSRVFGWMMGAAVMGSAALQATPLLTRGAIKPGDPASLGVLGLIIIVVASLAIPISLIFGREKVAAVPPKRATLKDYLAVISQPSMVRLVIADLLLTLGPGTTAPIYLFFFHEAKGFSLAHVAILLIPYTAAGVFGAPFWGRVAQKFGKHRTVQIAAVCYAVTQTTLMAIPQNLFWPTFAGMFSVGFCGSAFLLLVRAMVADVADQLRLETGQERSGVLFALVTMTQKFGSSITVSIIYPILAAVGFNPKPGAVNTPHAIWGLEMCYLFAPIVLVLVGATMFFGYRLDARKQAQIRAELDALEARDFAAAEESLLGPGEHIAPVR